MKKSILLFLLLTAHLYSSPVVVNDVTQINPISVSRVETPKSIEEIQNLVKEHSGMISIGGGRFSMGGQIATENALFIDTREFDQILDFDEKQKKVRVQSGITWRKIQEFIDPYNLSIKIKQTYSNFTVGGSLSVNGHGRYMGQGPLILSVDSIKIVLSDGRLVSASPKENPEIFYASIGGYGGIGVIVEAVLQLTDNSKVSRSVKKLPISEYKKFFFENVRTNSKVVFHNGDIYPPSYENVNAITWAETDEAVTVQDRLVPVKEEYWMENIMYFWLTELPYGKEFREHVYDPNFTTGKRVVWRNFEASYDVKELEPPTRKISTYVLQEYFVPVEKFDEFYPKMREVLQKHDVNVMNISIRHSYKDPGSLLAWARSEVFSFVIYYKQRTYPSARNEVGVWTRELIDAVVSVGGAYYLPYQPHANQVQFEAAYPDSGKFFELKRKLDPNYKFRNKLWDKYYFSDIKDQKIRLELDSNKTYRRNEDQTFLTVPEWFIVFSSDEYAKFQKHSPPSDFPYWASIGQFWKIYGNIIQKTWEYETNWGYHLMICVIGVSYSGELALKSVYENTIGALTEWIDSRKEIGQDRKVEAYIQWVAQDYTDFVRLKPWYEYPFYSKFLEFVKIEDGNNVGRIRSWERRIFFSMELLAKAGYGWLIGLGTGAVYEPENFHILAWANENGTGKIISIPRYEPFTKEVPVLVEKGISFKEIAGNKKIVLTTISSENQNWEDQKILSSWPILTEPGKKRTALILPVDQLHLMILYCKQNGILIDHIFDY
ncbi:FAD-binding oxidoreductase [Leptospira selangorensis]|uniref:FAD-binding oxidoreductase n=1 Tax=Leptospira selangorensis TaxID=2484982 RepID=A0A5F2C0F1_9LEPT|nr:FAD-dependent oxidoreductase [Leptospira selangorensis]TGM15589.1 FAD-binding oxidoreductase [Leptospira selangorensis]TGM18461.1 FAD-binding oxidoreductase [Leptospira selangorensis]